MMKKILVLFFAVWLALIPLVACAATAAYVDTGNNGTLNVRKSRDVSSKNVIAQLPHGTEVKITEYFSNKSWARIEFIHDGKNMTGYVMTRYLSSSKPSSSGSSSSESAAISFDGFKHVSPYYAHVRPATPGGFVNMRWAPSKSSAVMTKLYANTQLTVIAQNSTWAQVYNPSNDYVGFVMRTYLK